MTQHQMRTSFSTIRSYLLCNDKLILDTKSLLALGAKHPQTALVIEIYQFQLQALAKLASRSDLLHMIQNFPECESQLQARISKINREPIAQAIALMQHRLYYFEWMLLISLMILWSSMLIILFTGPIFLMLGLIASSAIMSLAFGFAVCTDGHHLFLHQEGLKAIDNPFFSRTAKDNCREINQSLKSYEMALEEDFFEYSWHSHLALP